MKILSTASLPNDCLHSLPLHLMEALTLHIHYASPKNTKIERQWPALSSKLKFRRSIKGCKRLFLFCDVQCICLIRCLCTPTPIVPAVLNSTRPPNGNLTARGSVRYQYTHQNKILLWEQFIDLCILLSLGLLFNYFYPLRWKRRNVTSKADKKVACFNFFF